jgi:hypothetical protein
MVKVCVPGYSILGQRRVSARCPLEKHPHSSLRGWSHPSLRGYSSMSLEYPKLNTWTEANLGKFLIPLLYEGLFSFSFSTKVYLWDFSFLLYEGLFLLYEGLAMGSKKISCGPKSFNGIIPCYPSAGHHPSTG